MEKLLFTSESVTEGHPDKVCDAISDAILDALMAQDPMSRVACETATCTGFVLVTGEITTKAYVDIPKSVRDTVKEIGYDKSEYGFDGNTCAVFTAIDEQSGDIAMGVDKALEAKMSGNSENKMSDRGDRRRRSGYDVRLRVQRDRGVYALSDLAGTQAGAAVDKSPQGWHTQLSETGRKDTGVRGVRRERQAEETRGGRALHTA